MPVSDQPLQRPRSQNFDPGRRLPHPAGEANSTNVFKARSNIWPHSKGYRVTIEKEILGGTGSVDVALERDSISIACEISVTTDVEHELGNIQKCLAAGFDHVVLVSGNKQTLNKGRSLARDSLAPDDFGRIRFLTADGFSVFLEELDATAASTVQTVRGYKVKTEYKSLTESDQKARKKVIAETILRELRKEKHE